MTMIALAVVLLLAGVAAYPKKSPSPKTSEPMFAPQPQPIHQVVETPRQSYVEPAVALQSVSLREQQVAEEADAIANVYRERAHEAWVAELTKNAAALLAGKTAKS